MAPLLINIVNKILSLVAIALMSINTANAQDLKITSPIYDCGQVSFRSPVTTTFTLHNNTSHNVKIKEILTSCGCTKAVPSATTVESGQDVTISATYDAKQLGHFQKDLWVYQEGSAKPIELSIRGVVVTEVKDWSGSYPYTLGKIRCDQTDVEFDDVSKGFRPTREIHILNSTGETIEPQVMHLPAYLSATVSPSRIAPDHAGLVRITLNSSKLRDTGLTQTSLYLGAFPGDKISADKTIDASVILLPSFGAMDDQTLNSSPVVELSSTVLKKSEMSGKPKKLKGEITISNTGHSQLNISSLQMFTTGLQVSLGKSKLNPNESTKLKVIADDTQLQQLKSRPRILMITNDPRQPKVIIEIQ